MSEAPFTEDVKQALDEYRAEMEFFDVDIESSYHIEEKGWMGVKLRTYHDGVHVLLKVLRNHGFLPTQINRPDEGDGLEIFIDQTENVHHTPTGEENE